LEGRFLEPIRAHGYSYFAACTSKYPATPIYIPLTISNLKTSIVRPVAIVEMTFADFGLRLQYGSLILALPIEATFTCKEALSLYHHTGNQKQTKPSIYKYAR
jgi:hypothetical protein